MEGSAACCDAKMEESPEESTWTFYIQGFLCDNNNNDNNDNDDNHTLSSDQESPSLVSDAASSAVKKLANTSRENQRATLGFSPSKNNYTMSRQNSFKKQKTKIMPAITDNDLEDTASSPVNSPKASYINQFMNQRQKAKMEVSDSEVMRNNIGKGGVFGVERNGSYTHDLKKKTTWHGVN